MRLRLSFGMFLLAGIMAGCGAIPGIGAPPTTAPLANATLIPTAERTPPPTAAPSAAPTATTALDTEPSAAPTMTMAPEAPSAAPWPPVIALHPFADGFDRPLYVTHAGDGSGRLFVVEKIGRIQIVRDGQTAGAPFLDITDRVGARANEQGLLSVAFHPRYRDNGLLFVNYTNRDGDTVIARFNAAGDSADPASEQVLLTIDQPYGNHNGGLVKFGPDGMLYIGMGDGGSANDPLNAGQDLNTLLGKILRINVDELPYTIPADNPWANGAGGRQEIWALGVRNPWRFSFDRATGDLFIGDVGQNRVEEIHLLAAGQNGANLGWRIMEGNECFQSEGCDNAGLELPIDVYPHSLGCSVTGGYVYRGASFAGLQGIYLFSDFCSGTIWGLRQGVAGWERADLLASGMQVASFGEDEAGELYLTDYGDGAVYQVVVE